jgi:hypothetical protein
MVDVILVLQWGVTVITLTILYFVLQQYVCRGVGPTGDAKPPLAPVASIVTVEPFVKSILYHLWHGAWRCFTSAFLKIREPTFGASESNDPRGPRRPCFTFFLDPFFYYGIPGF